MKISQLLVAGLWLGLAMPASAHEDKAAHARPAGQAGHADHEGHADHGDHAEGEIKLTAAQIETGRFAVDAVRPGVTGRRISVPGSIVPSGDHIARIAVRLVGTVSELRKRLGDPVTQGEVVAVIESREVADAKSEYLAARLVFELQETLFQRANKLFTGAVLSENDFLRARTTFEDARIKREVSRQKLFALSLTAEQIEALPQQPVEALRRQELRAPIAGRVAERRVELGALVGREGQESELFVIVDLATVWVELAMSPADLSMLREGQRITIASGAGAPSPATIMFVSPLLDKDTRTARVVASVDNADAKWRPGAFVTAEITESEASALFVVPKAALQTVEGASVVFVRTDHGFEKRKVDLGRQDDRVSEVTSGLAAGERIATANTFVLKAEFGKAEATHDH